MTHARALGCRGACRPVRGTRGGRGHGRGPMRRLAVVVGRRLVLGLVLGSARGLVSGSAHGLVSGSAHGLVHGPGPGPWRHRDHVRRTRTGVTGRDVLLAAGMFYAASYVVANDGIAASRYPGYDRIDQAVSELSAKGAPTRPFLVGMSAVWTPAMMAFGLGVGLSARGRRALRATGALLVGFGAMSLGWLPFPMTAREDMRPGTTAANDVGHLAMGALTVLLMLAQIGSGAVALGKRFRWYSIVTGAIMLVCGGSVARLSAGLAAGKPTPRLGLYERASIGAWLTWITVLAATLMREGDSAAPAPAPRCGRGRPAAWSARSVTARRRGRAGVYVSEPVP